MAPKTGTKDPARDACEHIFKRVRDGTATPEELAIMPQILTPYWGREATVEVAESQPELISITTFPARSTGAEVGIEQVCKFVGRSRTWIMGKVKEELFPEPIGKDGGENRWNSDDIWLWKDCRDEQMAREKRGKAA